MVFERVTRKKRKNKEEQKEEKKRQIPSPQMSNVSENKATCLHLSGLLTQHGSDHRSPGESVPLRGHATCALGHRLAAGHLVCGECAHRHHAGPSLWGWGSLGGRGRGTSKESAYKNELGCLKSRVCIQGPEIWKEGPFYRTVVQSPMECWKGRDWPRPCAKGKSTSQPQTQNRERGGNRKWTPKKPFGMEYSLDELMHFILLGKTISIASKKSRLVMPIHLGSENSF